MASETFFAQESANRRNSFLLVLVVCALFGALGFAIGYAIAGSASGALIVTAIAFSAGILISLSSWFAGDRAGPRRVRREAGHRGARRRSSSTSSAS